MGRGSWAFACVASSAALVAVCAIGVRVDSALRAQGQALARVSAAAAREPARIDPDRAQACTEVRAETIDSAGIDALAARVASKIASAPPSSAPPAESDEARRERQEAAVRASRLVDAAVARGRWTGDDARALRREMERLGGSDDARDVMRQMAVAINTGKLVPEDLRRLF